MEGLQAQLRYAQLRVQSLEQEMKSVKQELEQKVCPSTLICFFDIGSYRFDSRKKKIPN